MSAKKIITYNGLLHEVYSRPREIDNQEVLQLLRQANAAPQRCPPFNGHLFVLDYTQRRHVGFSGQTQNLIGYDPRDIMNEGIEFVISLFQADDFKIFNETVFSQITGFLKSIPPGQHADYLFSFSFRIKKAGGKWIHLFQQGSFITDPKTRLPIYSIGLTIDITPLKKDNSIIFSIDKKAVESGVFGYQNIQTSYYYPDPEESRLSRREREILGWLADGMSTKQVAGKLFISENTVANHRKNILKKTNSKNVAELIRYASGKGLI